MSELGERKGADTLRFVRHFNASIERSPVDVMVRFAEFKPLYDARFANAV
jgi:hypothetical protein